MKRLIFLSFLCCHLLAATAQQDVLEAARKTNDYFMQKYSDPTEVTFVHNKKRPSSLWTRAVYYEGLMALYGIDRQQRYLDYTDRWASFHQWTPRNGVKTCLHDNGFLGWNQGTGKQPSDSQPVTFTSVPDFEDYGTGCYLLGLVEYYKLKVKGLKG